MLMVFVSDPINKEDVVLVYARGQGNSMSIAQILHTEIDPTEAKCDCGGSREEMPMIDIWLRQYGHIMTIAFVCTPTKRYVWNAD